MTTFLIFDWQKFTKLVYCAICTSLIILVSGCGEGQHSYSETETGSIAFRVEWKDAPTIEGAESNVGAVYTASIDCVAAGVVDVTFEIYDENDTYLVGDSWPCSAHSGTVHNVPAGFPRMLVVTGENSDGTILYQGEVTAIRVTGGQTTDVGTVVMADTCGQPSSGTITGWSESGEFFVFDFHVSVRTGIVTSWSGNMLNPDRGWFYGYDSTEIAHITGISDISDISDPTVYTWDDNVVGPVDEGDFVLLHDTQSDCYGAIRVDDIYCPVAECPAYLNTELDATWFFIGCCWF